MGKKWEAFWGGQLLTVFSQAKGVYALKDSSQDLYLCGKDGVCEKEGGKGKQEQAGRAGVLRAVQGVQRQRVPLHGEHARMEGWEGRCPLQMVFWKCHTVYKAFENMRAPMAL